jgi:H+/Cl- antiporter ClcA
MGTVLKEEPVMFRYVAWVSWMMVSSSISMFLVWLSPGSAAEGSGVAHVKALLHHWVFTPEIFCWQTWIIKLIGLSFSVGCGLWLGKVDVHIAVILCVLLLKLPIFKNINDNEEDRYQMYVCASCVGLGVNFGVPISAVLFGLELSGSYYRSKIYLKAMCVTHRPAELTPI